MQPAIASQGIEQIARDALLHPANAPAQRVWDAAARHLVLPRWWEKAAALKIVTLKKDRSFGFEMSIDPVKASQELDEIKAQGFQAIEVFGPAYGRYAYSGLDTVDHYRIDPELGSMDDFKSFVRLAHLKGIAVIVFSISVTTAQKPPIGSRRAMTREQVGIRVRSSGSYGRIGPTLLSPPVRKISTCT